MTDETLWSIIEQVPHREYADGSVARVHFQPCPRCKLEAKVRQLDIEWRCNNLNRTTHCADALGVPLDTPAKVK